MESVAFISFYNCECRVVQKNHSHFFQVTVFLQTFVVCSMTMCKGHHTLNVLNFLLSKWLYSPDTAWNGVLPGLVAGMFIMKCWILRHHDILVFWRSASIRIEIGLHSQLCDKFQPKIFCCLWSHLRWQFQLSGEITCSTLWRIMCVDACNRFINKFHIFIVCQWNRYVVVFTIFSVDRTICVLWS